VRDDLNRARAARSAGRPDEARAILRGTLDRLLAPPAEASVAANEAEIQEIAELAYVLEARRDAERAYEALLRHREDRATSEDDLDLQLSRIDVGRVCRDLGNLSRARDLQSRAVEVLARTRPQDDPQTLRAREELGLTLERCGEPAAALELLREVLDARSRLLPPDHPDVLRARIHVAIALKPLGRLEEARAEEEIVLEMRARTLPADDLDLQVARMNLAVTLHDLGRLAESRALKEQALEVYERVLPADSFTLATARSNLGATLFVLGDYEGALRLIETALSTLERTLAPESAELQSMRVNAGVLRRQTKDLAGSRELIEQACSILERTRPPEDERLQEARLNLAITLRLSGEIAEAQSLIEKVLAVYARTRPPDDFQTTYTREVLGILRSEQGDWEGAAALLQEVVAVYERILPEDHPNLHAGRMNLGMALVQHGDFQRGRDVLEAVLDFQTRTLPPGHQNIQDTRLNLAAALTCLGDHAGARALEEQALEDLLTTLPEEHPSVFKARSNLASSCYRAGEYERAEQLDLQVLETMERTVPEDHADLQRAREALASDYKRTGKLAEARRLEEQALEALSRTHPREHPAVQKARIALAGTLFRLGEAEASVASLREYVDIASAAPRWDPTSLRLARRNLARELSWMGKKEEAAVITRELLASVRSRLDDAATSLSTREAEEAAGDCSRDLSASISLGLFGGIGDADPSWADELFAAVESARGIGIRVLRMDHMERTGEQAERIARLREEIRGVGSRIAAFSHEGGEADALQDLVRVRDRKERELRAELAAAPDAGSLGETGSADGVRSRLGAGEVAVGYWRFQRIGIDPAGAPETPELVALVLRRDRPVRAIGLARMSAIEAAVTDWRKVAASSDAELRGVGVGAQSTVRGAEWAAGARLRELVLDPLRAEIGEAERVFVAADDVLHLVPFDALPDFDSNAEEDRRIGDSRAILLRSTLMELASPARPRPAGSELLALGGIDYSTAETGSESASTVFAELPATLDEARAIVDLHRTVAGENARDWLLTGADATVAELESLAPRCRFLHLATHGYFAPDSVPSIQGTTSDDGSFDSRRSVSERVRGFAPMTLCGLALSGANARGSAGSAEPGVITAEELGALDLSGCELAVLSACETSVGLRRSGQGLSSLQKGLQAAGVRSSVTSLWKVPDEATRELMVEFYRRLWVEEQPAHEALWGAKLALRRARDADGRARFAISDWAGWVLCGDTD